LSSTFTAAAAAAAAVNVALQLRDAEPLRNIRLSKWLYQLVNIYCCCCCCHHELAAA
jgi:hypothetical protein